MRNLPPGRSWPAWLAVLAWVVFIYLTIPVARALQGWVDEHLGRTAFLYAVAVALVVGVAAAARSIRASARSPANWVWLVAVAAAFAWGTWHLRANPEEAMHFVQYGVLSWLLFRACRTRFQDTGLYGLAFLLGAGLGMVDELIQWVTPRRFFDFRDMLINVCAVGLVQVALAKGVQPSGITSPARANTLRLAWRASLAVALLLILMLGATPGRVEKAARWIPWLPRDEPLVEYGHALQGPGSITWVTRLAPADLARQDRVRAAELGPQLARFSDDQAYAEFLLAYPSSVDPFAHELRVHLFRRDRYLKLARAQRRESMRRAELLTVAFREQEILETYFGQTLQASGLDWTPETRARLAASALSGPYASPVSRHLIVRWQPWHLQAMPVLAVIAFGLYVGYVARQERAGL